MDSLVPRMDAVQQPRLLRPGWAPECFSVFLHSGRFSRRCNGRDLEVSTFDVILIAPAGTLIYKSYHKFGSFWTMNYVIQLKSSF